MRESQLQTTTEIREEYIGNKTWEAHDWPQTLVNPMLLTTPWNTPSFLCLAQWIFLKIDDNKINCDLWKEYGKH